MNTTPLTSSLPTWAVGYTSIRVSHGPITLYRQCQFCGAKSIGHKVTYLSRVGRFDDYSCQKHANELLDAGLCLWYKGTGGQ